MNVILARPDAFTERYLTTKLGACNFYYLVETEDKILKKNITFDYDTLRMPDLLVVGAEPLKHLFRVSGVTKYSGTEQTFYNKEISRDVTVKILLDPNVINLYPMKEKLILDHINQLQQPTKPVHPVTYKVNEGLDALLAEDSPIALDIETSALSPFKGEILTIQFSNAPYTACLYDWDTIDKAKLQRLLLTKKLVLHNAKFDLKWLKYNGLQIPDTFDDTMLMYATIDENDKKDLKTLAIKFTDLGAYDEELNAVKKKYCRIAKVKIADFNYSMLPREVLAPYALKDADATIRLFYLLKPNKKAYSLLIKYTRKLIDIELKGCKIDADLLQQSIADIQSKIDKLHNEMLDELPEDLQADFNFNSVKQLQNLFFNVLGFTPVKETASGAPSTDAESLNELSKKYNNKVLSNLLDYRKLNKFLSTYLLSIYKNVDSDGKIRSTFNVAGTTSGRLSSSTPINFQNLPSKDKLIKKLFIPENGKIINLDLKTAEIWVAAYLSGDEFLQDIFKQGGDFHSMIAKLVFDLPCDVAEVKAKFPDKRQAAKAISFGILYQAGANKVAQTLGISKKVAQDYIKLYFKRAYKLKEWIDTNISIIENTGEITSYFGRVRHLPEVFSANHGVRSHAIKSGINFLIQSVANDLNLLATCELMEKTDFVPFTLVHDSVAGEVKDEEEAKRIRDIYAEAINKILPDAFAPIGVDAEIGESYGNLTALK